MAEPHTLYKLIILYMLKKVNFPLTNAQISNFVLDQGYTTYFTLQEIIHELLDSGLIHGETIRNPPATTSLTPAPRLWTISAARFPGRFRRISTTIWKKTAFSSAMKSRSSPTIIRPQKENIRRNARYGKRMRIWSACR